MVGQSSTEVICMLPANSKTCNPSAAPTKREFFLGISGFPLKYNKFCKP